LRAKFFPGHKIAWALQQNREYFQGLALQAQLYAAFAELAGAKIQLKDVEVQNARRCGWGGHVDLRKLGKAYHSSWPLEICHIDRRTPFLFKALAMEKTLGT
jgi:hypothetical protein